MQIKKYTLGACLSLLAVAVMAQQPQNFCGYTGFSTWLDNYQRHSADRPDGAGDTAWLYVPMTIQIVGEDDGAGYFPLDGAIRAVCDMNAYYTPAHIRFYLMPGDPVRYLNNSEWFKHDWDKGAELINSNKLPNRLNAFVVADPAGNCGYSWQDAIVLGKGCSGPDNTTWSHEAGHHFSLPHTFSGWEGFDWNYSEPAPPSIDNRTVEKVDGTNCYNAGDRFCDTEPDYLNYRWPCNDDKRSTVLQHDPNGAEFRSDATLIMGYASDACASRFSEEQIEAMRANLQDEEEHADYLQISSPLTEINDTDQTVLISPIDTALVQFNNMTFKWNPVPNATLYTVEISFLPTHSTDLVVQTVYNATTLTVTKALPNNHLLYWRVRAYNEWDVCQPFDAAQTGVFKTQNLTATNDFEREVSGELSPNPVAGGLPATLVINAATSVHALLTVNDAAGRLCYQQPLRLQPDENRLDISTLGLNAGLYIVTLRNEKGAMIKKLVVTE